MTLDFSEKGKCIIRMDDYVESVLEDVTPDMDGEAETPAAEHLFDVDDKAVRLGQHGSEDFHSLTARLLFLAKRARPEIQTAIAFLCTRTRAPDKDDYKKLRRVVQYLRKYPRLMLTLEADETKVVKWSMDVSYGVHPDMKSHTGGSGLLGKGSFSATSSKQKVNTRSSREAKLVGVDDMMGKILWTQYFLKAQGYEVGPAQLLQDNESAIKLEKNGKRSSTKQTRHLNIRYFFVTDKIQNGDMVVAYCPTGDMEADVLTKPLQGQAFRKLRAMLLNLKDDCSRAGQVHWQDHRSVLRNSDESNDEMRRATVSRTGAKSMTSYVTRTERRAANRQRRSLRDARSISEINVEWRSKYVAHGSEPLPEAAVDVAVPSSHNSN